MDIDLPHLAPIKFAKRIYSKELNKARVGVEFDETPSLAMLVEAAAQSSSAIGNDSVKNAYLVGLKNIKQLTPPTSSNLEIEVINNHSLENMKLISFNIFQEKKIIANGSFTIAVQ